MDPCPICGAPDGAASCGCPAGAPAEEPQRVRPYAPRPQKRAGSRRGPAIADLGLFAAEREPGAEPVPGGSPQHRGSHRARRRRRGPVIAGLAFAATALTAAAVGLALRASPQQERPEHARPVKHPSHLEAAPTAAPGSHAPTPAPTVSHHAPPTARATRTPPPAPAKSTRPASSAASHPGGHSRPHSTHTPRGRRHHHGRHGVLKPGDTGPDVADLQRRLARVGLYAGAPDGRYDGGVKAAVARYQDAYHVRGDPRGCYGPHTRRSLESRTGR